MIKLRLPSFKLRRRERVAIAVICALTIHLLLVVLGSLGIGFFSVPSNETRNLVINLQPSPEEGVHSAEQLEEATVNDADLGEKQNTKRDAPIDDALESPQKQLAQSSRAAESKSDVAKARPANQLNASAASNTSKPLVTLEQAAASHERLFTGLSDLKTLMTVEEPPTIEKVTASSEENVAVKQAVQKLVDDYIENPELNQQKSWEIDGQQYQATAKHKPSTDPLALDNVVVEVKTEQDGKQLTTELNLKQLAFSSFAQFVHAWDKETRFHDDVLDGRFHSNTRIPIEANGSAVPVFFGKVTTAHYRVDIESRFGRVRKKDIFRGGLETGVKRINMPKPKNLFGGDRPAFGNHTFKLNSETRLTFLEGGRVQIQDFDLEGPPQTYQLGEEPVYFIAEQGQKVHLSGVVSGKVMIYASKHIIIEDDFVYQNPTEDLVGLIADRNIIVAPPNVTGPGDLDIHASIYARGQFKIRRYLYDQQGVLTVFGSLSVGSFSATEPRYATKVVYDKRFDNLRPPNFPITQRYELAEQDVIWRTVEPKTEDEPMIFKELPQL